MKRYETFILYAICIFVGVGSLGGWIYLANEPVEAFTTSIPYPSTQYPEDGDTNWGAVKEAYDDSSDKQQGVTIGPAEGALADADTTPSVLNMAMWATTDAAAAYTITDFDDGVRGQMLRVRFVDSDVSVANSATAGLSLIGDYSPVAEDVLTLYTPDGTTWYEQARTSVANVPSYSAVYASSETVVINTVNTDTLASAGWITQASNGPAYNSTAGTFTIQDGGAGDYLIGFDISFQGGNNDTVHWHLYHNGVEDNGFMAERKLSAGGDVGSMGVVNIIAGMAVADSIKLFAEQDTTTTNQTVNHGSFWLKRVGP
jgi:hypothetical protein